MSREEKAQALLKGRINIAREECRAFIEKKAAELKRESDSVPFDAITQMLRRGLCDCQAALHLIDGE
jgi:hypothetical protein